MAVRVCQKAIGCCQNVLEKVTVTMPKTAARNGYITQQLSLMVYTLDCKLPGKSRVKAW